MKVAGRLVSVVGLGYVGLPVAMAIGRLGRVVAFDVKRDRVAELAAGRDRNEDVDPADFAQVDLHFTTDPEQLRQADFHVVAVPTPIDAAHRPDFGPLLSASETVGRILKPGDVVVYESTVYPGATEEVCVPVLERCSGLRGGVDFTVGYSPERINPGDREHSFTRIKKVVSGQDARTLDVVAGVYGAVVTAGVHRASSIRVAEAAKVIENTQRDLNIAFMNELAVLFDRLGLDTQEVLAAARTKWNFLGFQPGLVGGHCIGVDPYYLTHKAEEAGYIPQVILAGRRINDDMGRFIAHRTIKEMIRAGHDVNATRVTVLGLTFKEDCRDLRNSRVVDVIRELRDFGVPVQVHDPIADPEEAEREYGLQLSRWEDLQPAGAVVVAVAHRQYRALGPDELKRLMKTSPVLVDVKGLYDRDAMKRAGLRCWRL
jgi:UDP-N-acetyl-D-galactosamine dehydrogenase